jgi:hypothetical protein
MHVTFIFFTFFLCFYTKHNDGPFGPKHVAHFSVFHSVRCELIYKFYQYQQMHNYIYYY